MADTRTDTASQLAADAQRAAEHYWAVATGDGPEARYDSESYCAARDAYLAAMRAAFTLTAGQAQRAYELLSEYGPHDCLTWNEARVPAGQRVHGVASYAARVRLDLAEERAARRRAARQAEASRRRQAWYDARRTVDLAGMMRYASDTVTWRMLANLAARRAAAEPLGAMR